MTQYTTARTGYDTDAPQDSDNDFLCAVQLQRIATSLEEILRLVKQDMERMKKLNDQNKCRTRVFKNSGPSLALARGQWI